MEITKKSRNQLRLQNITFIVLFTTVIGLLAWLSTKYNIESDWTENNRNTLSEASIQLLQKMPAPVKITSFIPKGNLLSNRKYIEELILKYQKHKKDISLEIINPDTAPDKVRSMQVTNYGEIVVEYQGRNEHINQLKEQTLTNTLQRLLRQGERKILFVSGHGERKPNGQANFDWNNFTAKLKTKGISSDLLRLNETPNIPDVAAIVIASPQVDFLAGEVSIIIDYIKRGGNLLWVHEPSKTMLGLKPLADLFGTSFYPGTIVDPTAQMMNVNDPSFALITSYPSHALTRDFQYMSIFPKAVGIIHAAVKKDWQITPFLKTVPRSWSETGALKGTIDYNQDKDIVGPLTIGLALERKRTDKENKIEKQQRVVILGDGDFLSNSYLGNQGNLNMGNNIINWLSNDDNFISIPSSNAADKLITISELTGALIGLFFLILLPLALLVSGIFIWLKRRSA